jgi:two-component system OmpR family response regulator
VEFSPTEYKLLRYLAENPNRMLSKEKMLDYVWEYDFNGNVGIVESYISYLRRKVDPLATYTKIVTKRGSTPEQGGYMLKIDRKA